MHMFAPNFYGRNVPRGASITFAHKYKEDGGINFSLYGDGEPNQGQISEAFNLAKLWDLPAIFVCMDVFTGKEATRVPVDYYSYSKDPLVYEISMVDPDTNHWTRDVAQKVRQPRDHITDREEPRCRNGHH